jgi:hypothetical protein
LAENKEVPDRNIGTSLFYHTLLSSLPLVAPCTVPPPECRPHWGLVTLCVASAAQPTKISGTTSKKYENPLHGLVYDYEILLLDVANILLLDVAYLFSG